MFGSISAFCIFVLFFFFFFSRILEKYGYCLWTVYWLFYREQYISVLFMDLQISLFNNFFIKNGSYGTIYTFKNYFTTVFSVFSFQFQQNKFYLNITLISRNHWQWNKFYTDVDFYASNINPPHQIFATEKSRNCCTKSHFHSNTLNLILFTFTRLLRKQCVKPILRN